MQTRDRPSYPHFAKRWEGIKPAQMPTFGAYPWFQKPFGSHPAPPKAATHTGGAVIRSFHRGSAAYITTRSDVYDKKHRIHIVMCHFSEIDGGKDRKGRFGNDEKFF